MLVKQTNPENNIHSELKLAEKLKNRKKAVVFPGMIVNSGQIM